MRIISSSYAINWGKNFSKVLNKVRFSWVKALALFMQLALGATIGPWHIAWRGCVIESFSFALCPAAVSMRA
jgi:hypothetical protein